MVNKKIRCPQCGRETVYTRENTSRPFCSERCQLIDLGEWASEKYKVAATEQPQHEQSEPTQIDSTTSDEKPAKHDESSK